MTKHEHDYIPGLDGLRAIAVLWVLLYHFVLFFSWGSPDSNVVKILDVGSKTGWQGVQLFFVLSGYLITGILLDGKGTSSQYRNFLMRRMLRIFPLYYTTLIFLFVVLPFFVSELPSNVGSAKKHEIWFWLYLVNWVRPFEPLGGLTHFWSLAVEEQFYLFWPFVVMFVPRASLAVLSLFIVLVTPAIRAYLVYSFPGGAQVGIDAAYFFTIARWDALALGALLAVVMRYEHLLKIVETVHLPLLLGCIIYFALQLLLVHSIEASGPGVGIINQSISAIMFASIIYRVGTRREEWLTRTLETRFFSRVGKYSYAVYVFQMPVIMFLHRTMTNRFEQTSQDMQIYWAFFTLGVIVLCTLALSWLSWRLIEMPFLKLKRNFSS